MIKLIKNLIFLAVLGFIGFYFRVPILNLWSQFQNRYLPCRVPISYNIATFDTRFGLTEKEFLGAVKDAEAIWEKPISKDLFVQKENGNLKINLVYDDRQASTVLLQNMGVEVHNTKASYDELKSKYNTLRENYENQKSLFESRLSAYQVRKKSYEAEVRAVNRKGGANEEEFKRLNTEKEFLNSEMISINKLQDSLNNTIDEVNALVGAMNQLAKILNLSVERFNTIGGSLGGEFEEGAYQSGPEGQEINIYQFENRAKLVRVLAHELGHALGLEHIEDPKAIMYRLNNGVNEKLTTADLLQLKTHCGIK